MNLTTHRVAPLVVTLAIFGLGSPAANGGLDRGIGVAPSVAGTAQAPTSKALSRFLSNDRRHHHAIPAARASHVPASSNVGDSTSVLSTGAGAVAAALALALVGGVSLALLRLRRTKLAS